MKKIIIGIFVLALLVSTTVSAERRGGKDRKSDNSATSTRSELRNKNASSTKDVDETCVSSAVAVREDSIAEAWDIFSTNISVALTVRKDNLTDAWKITDAKERKVALKKAWDASKKSKKEASSEYKKTKKEIWATFKTSVKKCGSGVGSEASGESEAGEKIEI